MFKDLVKTDGYARPFYEVLKKGTEHVVDRLFITGVMPIPLDSLTSGFNIAKNMSTDARFNEMFGFTEDEIRPILNYLDNAESLEHIRTYYDGYRFSPEAEQTVYNSDMIVNYGFNSDPKTKRSNIRITPDPEKDVRNLHAILSLGGKEFEEEILLRIVERNSVLIHGLSRAVTFPQEASEWWDNTVLIRLLFYMGYLTIAGKRGIAIELKVPNRAVKHLYEEYMQAIKKK
jgi:hypothetical protein